MKTTVPLKPTAKALLFLSLLLACATQGAPGDLDLSFAGTGTTRIGFGFGDDFARAVAVQADGKLVVAGSTGTSQFFDSDFVVTRYGTNNLLDASFGSGGKVITPVGSGRSGATAASIQLDGKIVLAGYTYNGFYNSFALVRYNPNGSLDASFGTNGIVITDFGPEGAQANAMVIQSDGKIVVTGGYSGAGSGDFAMARYTTNGAPDLSFGGTGYFVTEVQSDASARAITLQPDGKILVAGSGFVVAVLRYNTNGILDTTFGVNANGKVFTTIAPGSVGWATAVRIQPGDFTVQNPDKIVVAGYAETGFGQYQFAVLRYDLSGVLDPTFNGSGIVTNAVGPGNSFGHAALVQGISTQPRKITVAGYSQSGTNYYFALARYNANGSFDTTFGTNGTALFSFGPKHDDQAYAMAIQAGRLVAVGSSVRNENNADFAIMRYNSDGLPDATFDGDGIITTDVSDRPASARAVAVQPDGKTVVAGSADIGVNNVIAIARLNPNGTLDSSFGVSGKVTTTFGAGGVNANAMALQLDGKIVVAGSGYNGTNDDFAVVRYNSNGSRDDSFGTNGIVMTPIGVDGEAATSVTLQPDGKIVAAGSSFNGTNNDFAAVRYHINGTPDTTFDGDGKVTTAIATGNDLCTAVKVQSDGKIVIAGYTEINANLDFALARYTTNGALDNSFGSFGRVATDIESASPDAAFAMAIQPNGRIIVAGYTINGPSVDVGLVRYNTNGTPDTSFDSDGKLTTPIGFATDYGTAISIQGDGKILVAGVSEIGAHSEFAAVRYHMDGSLDDSYGIGGKAIVDFSDDAENTASALALDSVGRAVIAGYAGDLFGVARLQTDPFLQILSITRLANGHNFLEGVGRPGVTHTLQASPSLSTAAFGALGSVNANAAGLWQYEDSNLTGVTNRFYRLSFP